MWNVVKAWGMYDFARARYTLLAFLALLVLLASLASLALLASVCLPCCCRACLHEAVLSVFVVEYGPTSREMNMSRQAGASAS